jgi:glycosyltransferase involved in cell wall biosynthesis
MDPKRVLYVSANGYLGGAENVVLTLANSHTPKYQPTILFFNDGEAVVMAKNLGLKTYLLQNSFRLSNPFSLFKALREIRNFIRNNHFDLIHTTMAYAHLVMGLATLFLTKKIVWFQHGPVGKKLDFLASFFKSDQMFFNSSYLQSLHEDSKLIRKVKKNCIVPLGIQSNNIERLLFQSESIHFAVAGRITSGKAIEYVIKALSNIKSTYPQFKFSLQIAGSAKKPKDLAYLQEIKKFILSLNMNEYVKFENHVSDMVSFYQNIDVLIHSTKEPEPFGLVIAEAMGNGCLVIAPDEGGVKDFVINNQTGLTYHSSKNSERSINELTVKLQLLIRQSNHQMLQQYANSGKSLVKYKYTFKNMLKTVEEAYDEVLS